MKGVIPKDQLSDEARERLHKLIAKYRAKYAEEIIRRRKEAG